MLRSALGKVMWVGRATALALGIGVMLAVVVGLASAALGADGDFFKVGRSNFAETASKLIKSGEGPALRLVVDSGAPLSVNSGKKVGKLHADRLDGKDSGDFFAGDTYVKQGQLTVPVGGQASIGFRCDDEDVAVGGGYTGVAQETHVHTNGMGDLAGQFDWQVGAHNSGTTEDDIDVQVRCADFAPAHIP